MEIASIPSIALQLPEVTCTGFSGNLRRFTRDCSEQLLEQINPGADSSIFGIIRYGSVVAGTSDSESDLDLMVLYDRVPSNLREWINLSGTSVDVYPMSYSRLLRISTGELDLSPFSHLCFGVFLLSDVYTQLSEEEIIKKKRELLINLHNQGDQGNEIWERILGVITQYIVYYEGKDGKREKRIERREIVAQMLNMTPDEWVNARRETKLPTLDEVTKAYGLA